MSSIAYRREIDGLRTIAVMSVVIYHAEFVINGMQVLPGGFLGVDIFFVISGYLISSIILKAIQTGDFSFGRFYERRARRILPILLVVMISSLPFAWFHLLPPDLIDFCNQLYYSIFFTSNFYFWAGDPYWDVESNLKPFLHTWSLAVEEQFYFIMPALLVFIMRFKKSALLVSVAVLGLMSLIFAHWSSTQYPDMAFFLLPSRMWELLSGSLLAVLQRQGVSSTSKWQAHLPSLGMLLILCSFMLIDQSTRHPSLLTLTPVVGTMLIIWFEDPANCTIKLLSTKVFVGIGLISYGIYLWHFPVFAFARIIQGGAPRPLVMLLLILAVIGLSIVSYFLVERPLRDQAKTSLKKLTAILTTLLVVIISFTLAGQETGFKHRLPTLVTMPSTPKILENHQWTRTTEPHRGAVMTVGDSHMRSISEAVKSASLQGGFDYATSSYVGCQLLIGADRVLKKNAEEFSDCMQPLQMARLKFIKNAQPSFIVLGGRLPLIMHEARFDNKEGLFEGPMMTMIQNKERSLASLNERNAFITRQYQITVDALLIAGHTVVLIYPIPEVGGHVPKILLNKIAGDYFNAAEIVSSDPLTTDYPIFLERTRSSYQLLDAIKGEGIIRVFPEKLFCNLNQSGRCVTHDAQNSFYRDNNHLSPHGAKMLTEIIFKRINEQIHGDK